ncbi:MAG: hypothetical protein MAG451_00695 [Anaerolineales bacterium]|nr:hypothetical protein [Anaerolineales bacterium]
MWHKLMYRRLVETNDLQTRILELARAARADAPTSIEDASRAIGQLFDQGEIPASFADAIRDAYIKLGRQRTISQLSIDDSQLASPPALRHPTTFAR